MLDIASILTNTTCGLACWHAHDQICRCSCGGKNHGCLTRDGGKMPDRMAKIDGHIYTLTAVGDQSLYADADKVNRSVGYRSIDPMPSIGRCYYYSWRETESGAPARVKPATASQVKRWIELEQYRGQNRRPLLLWVRTISDEELAAGLERKRIADEINGKEAA